MRGIHGHQLPSGDKAAESGMRTIWRVVRYLRRYPFLASGMLACAIVGTLMVLVFPYVTRDVLDVVIRQHHPERLIPLTVLAVLAALIQNGLNSLRLILNNTFEQKVIFDLRSDLYSHIQLLPLRWFDNRATGDLMTRLLEDVTSVERVLIDGIEQGVMAVLQIAVVFAIMCFISFKLTLFALSPVPFLAGGALWYTLTAHRRYRLQRRAASAMNALLHDNLSGIRQIRSFAREEDEHRRFNRVSDELRRATLIVMKVWAAYNPSMYLIGTLGVIVTVLMGTQAVLAGSMELGSLVMFLLLTGYLYEPVGKLHQLNQLLQAGRAAGERVFEIMDEAIEPGWKTVAAAGDRGQKTQILGDVRYEDVSFSYSAGGQAALSHVTFHAPPGQTVALVGTTGAGKSTLVNLLARFYEFDSGEILIDGKPVRDYDLRSLRESIGVVTQESFLFNGTIRENLLMGRPDARGRRSLASRRRGERARFHRTVAGQAGQRSRRARREIKRRRKAAAVDRAGVVERSADSDFGRSHCQRGHNHRAPDPGSARTFNGEPHVDRDCAPAFHDRSRGSNSGPRPRPDH